MSRALRSSVRLMNPSPFSSICRNRSTLQTGVSLLREGKDQSCGLLVPGSSGSRDSSTPACRRVQDLGSRIFDSRIFVVSDSSGVWGLDSQELGFVAVRRKLNRLLRGLLSISLALQGSQEFQVKKRYSGFVISGLTREDPEPENSKNSKTSWICRGFPPDYNTIFVYYSNSL